MARPLATGGDAVSDFDAIMLCLALAWLAVATLGLKVRYLKQVVQHQTAMLLVLRCRIDNLENP